jgi:hypothetical protein
VKRALFISLLIISSSLRAGSHSVALPNLTLATYEFAMSLQPSANNARFTCAIVKVYEGKVIRAQFITTNDFVLQATGLQESVANPEYKNLISTWGVDNCVASVDPVMGDYAIDCNPVYNVWKLRYKSDPTTPDAGEEGWSNKPLRPSDGQMTILSQYGIHHIAHFTFGDNAFKLLKDLSQPAWVAAYKGS